MNSLAAKVEAQEYAGEQRHEFSCRAQKPAITAVLARYRSHDGTQQMVSNVNKTN
jgi:hypothetical protein